MILLINIRKVFGEIRIVFSFYLVNRKDPFFNLFYVNFFKFFYTILCVVNYRETLGRIKMLINIFFESEYYIDILNKLLISIFNWIHIRRINKCNKKDNKIYIFEFQILL